MCVTSLPPSSWVPPQSLGSPAPHCLTALPGEEKKACFSCLSSQLNRNLGYYLAGLKQPLSACHSPGSVLGCCRYQR